MTSRKSLTWKSLNPPQVSIMLFVCFQQRLVKMSAVCRHSWTFHCYYSQKWLSFWIKSISWRKKCFTSTSGHWFNLSKKKFVRFNSMLLLLLADTSQALLLLCPNTATLLYICLTMASCKTWIIQPYMFIHETNSKKENWHGRLHPSSRQTGFLGLFHMCAHYTAVLRWKSSAMALTVYFAQDRSSNIKKNNILPCVLQSTPQSSALSVLT